MFKGLFDVEFRLAKIDSNGDPLVVLKQAIDWDLFRPELEKIREKERKSNAGRKAYDVLLMFKMLVLQSLYNLSDDQLEIQVLDRLSFMRFLDLRLGDAVPDAKTVWAFREALNAEDRAKRLFATFDEFLRKNGFQARKGQIVDATIVRVPVQHNTSEENKRIKNGEGEELKREWHPAKSAQKDIHARWTKKNGSSFYGYKNHVGTDVKGKFIRDYAVSDAAEHDSNHFEELLDMDNASRDVWTDSAYRSKEHSEALSALGFREHIQRKGYRGHPLSERERRGNRRRSSIRSRVEHIFGAMLSKAGNLVMRCIGMKRARTTIGLRNLTYNLGRYAFLSGSAG
jgi:IS5 family transposase